MTEPPVHLVFAESSSDDGTYLAVTGEIDLATVVELRAGLSDAAAGPDPLTLDLGEVSFLDSTGLQVLLLLDEERRRDERPWKLVPSLAVRRVCEVSGVADRFGLLPAAD